MSIYKAILAPLQHISKFLLVNGHNTQRRANETNSHAVVYLADTAPTFRSNPKRGSLLELVGACCKSTRWNTALSLQSMGGSEMISTRAMISSMTTHLDLDYHTIFMVCPCHASQNRLLEHHNSPSNSKTTMTLNHKRPASETTYPAKNTKTTAHASPQRCSKQP